MSRWNPEPLGDRLLRQVTPGRNGCWIWTGYRHKRSGYGQIQMGTVSRPAHVISYETFVGPISDGLELDHTCRTRPCIRPDHLEPVTHRVNVLRGIAPTAANARKTECSRGHGPFDLVLPSGSRWCSKCQRINEAAAYERRKARKGM